MLHKIKVLLTIFKIWVIAEKKIGHLRFAQLIENYHTQIGDPYHIEDNRFIKSLYKYYKK